MTEDNFDFGMIGLGVMGSNLLLNMADHHFSVIGFDKDIQKGKALEAAAGNNPMVKGVSTLAQMVSGLKRPRKLMMLVPAGKPVDDVINDLLPLLEKNDVVIDGGNSHYTDTLRRVNFLQQKEIHFMGMGISGGEYGARTGPSIMPGGDIDAFKNIQPLLEAIAAKVSGAPCTAYMGKDAAGHYVKMVHNGIEYAIMQLISEVYDILKRGMNLNDDELHEIFKQWNEGELQSYLVEITRDIFLEKDTDTNNRLVDMILDKAGAKGTGKWTSQDAMDIGIGIPSIDTAVAFRNISDKKDERVQAFNLYKRAIEKINADKNIFIDQLKDALYFGMILCYAQGLSMLYVASAELKMEIPLQDVVKIWRGGCIIRSSLLEIFYNEVFRKNPGLSNILLDQSISKILQSRQNSLREVITKSVQSKISVGGLSSALAYFDSYTIDRMPTNLIQAQRDYFGAHTYQRIDKEGSFHTNWQGEA